MSYCGGFNFEKKTKKTCKIRGNSEDRKNVYQIGKKSAKIRRVDSVDSYVIL